MHFTTYFILFRTCNVVVIHLMMCTLSLHATYSICVVQWGSCISIQHVAKSEQSELLLPSTFLWYVCDVHIAWVGYTHIQG